MNSNGTANKGGKGPVTIKKDQIRPPTEEKKRSLFGGFLKSLGADPNNVKEFETRRTRTPPEPGIVARSPPRTFVEEFKKQIRFSEEESQEPESGTEPPAEARPKRSRDGHSAEFSLANLGNLSQGPVIPTGPAQADGHYAEISVAASGDGFDITDEDIDAVLGFKPSESDDVLGFKPSESTDGSREVSTTISEAIVQAAARLNGGRNPVKLRSDRPTLPPPAPTVRTEPPERDDTEARRTGILPGSPPETGFNVTSSALSKGEMTDRTRRRLNELSSMEQAAEIPLENTKLREKSYVPVYFQNMIIKLPERFHPYLNEAMEVIGENLKGYEPDVERLILERRWKIEREQRVLGSLSKAADEIQRVFVKMHKDEAVRRVALRSDEGTMVPAEAIKKWAFTLLSSRSPKDESKLLADSNTELNVFDAYAKAVTFLFLSQMRPRTFIYALGHPEISKPYGQLGGMEGLGVLAGLDLPNVDAKNPISTPLIGLAFRHAQECRSTTLIGWLQDVVAEWPKPFIVGRFAHFVEQEMRDFQEAVQGAGFSAERLFQVLNRNDNSPVNLRADPVLKHIFEAACIGPGSVVYNEPDDVFDALEAIVGYTNLLKVVPRAKDEFLEHFLGTYPLSTNGGTFWKVFCMCLFTDKEDMERHPAVVKALRNDRDPKIKAHIEEAIHILQPRETLIESSFDDEDNEIRFSLDGDGEF